MGWAGGGGVVDGLTGGLGGGRRDPLCAFDALPTLKHNALVEKGLKGVLQ